MNFNTLARHIREGTKSTLRNGWTSIAAIGAVVITLLLVGTFIALIFNINYMTHQVEKNVEIKVLIELTATDDDIADLGKKLNDFEEVESVSFNTKEEELDSLITSMGDQGEAWRMFENDNNPLNHAYVVKTTDPKNTEMIAEEIKSLKHIYKVNYGEDVIDMLFTFTNYSRTIGIVLVIGLVLTAVFLISNTIKLTIMARSREIGIMKLVGATNGFIRWPFFVEGIILGVIGSLIPITLLSIIYNAIVNSVSGKTEFEFVQLLPAYPFLLQLSAVILSIGIFIGVWGSVMSVRKFLKV